MDDENYPIVSTGSSSDIILIRIMVMVVENGNDNAISNFGRGFLCFNKGKAY